MTINTMQNRLRKLEEVSGARIDGPSEIVVDFVRAVFDAKGAQAGTEVVSTMVVPLLGAE